MARYYIYIYVGKKELNCPSLPVVEKLTKIRQRGGGDMMAQVSRDIIGARVIHLLLFNQKLPSAQGMFHCGKSCHPSILWIPW